MIWTAPTPGVAGGAIVEVHVFNVALGEVVISEITTAGIDLAKNVLSVHGVDANGVPAHCTGVQLAYVPWTG